MKTWTKVILGIAALPVILVVAGGVALVATGKWKQVAGFESGVLQLKHSAEGLKNLDKEFPFTSPAEGAIPRTGSWVTGAPRIVGLLCIARLMTLPMQGAAVRQRRGR